jgi:hypothetical protein
VNGRRVGNAVPFSDYLAPEIHQAGDFGQKEDEFLRFVPTFKTRQEHLRASPGGDSITSLIAQQHEESS